MATTKNNKKLNWRKDSVGDSSFGGLWKAGNFHITESEEWTEGFVAWYKTDIYDLNEVCDIISEDNPVADLATAKAICEEWREAVLPEVEKYISIEKESANIREALYEEEAKLEREWQKAHDKLMDKYNKDMAACGGKLDDLYEKIDSKTVKFFQKVEKDHPKPEPESVVTDAMIDAAIESMNSKQSRESVKKALEAAIEKGK